MQDPFEAFIRIDSEQIQFEQMRTQQLDWPERAKERFQEL